MESILFRSLFLFCVIHFSLAKEELIVPHAPVSVKFISTELLHSFDIANLFSAVLSYTVPKQIQWSSLAPVNPFHRPEAIIMLDIIGFEDNMELEVDGVHFLLENMGDVDGQYDVLAYRTYNRYSEKKPILMRVEAGDDLYSPKSEYPVLLKEVPASREERLKLILSDPELSQTIKDGTFNISVPGDTYLLRELATIKSLFSSLSKHKSLIKDGVPDIYWLKITGLQNLIEQYGVDSYQVSEGIRLLRQTLTEIISAVKSIYNDNALVSVVTENPQPITLVRKTRNLLEAQAAEKEDVKRLNLAPVWSPDFPVAFSIIAFLVIMLSLTILGISVAIWNMDPGQDSIMTGQRLKKD